MVTVGLISFAAFMLMLLGYLLAARRHVRGDAAERPARIADVAEGQASQVRGVVSVDAPLVAPFTGRPCAYWRIDVSFSRVAGPGLESLGYSDAASLDEITVTDGSGAALVLMERARIEVVADIVMMGRVSELTPAQRNVLDARGWRVPAISGIELSETIVEIGAPIDVIGHATREPHLEPDAAPRGYRDASATEVVFSGEPTLRGERRERRYLGPMATRDARR